MKKLKYLILTFFLVITLASCDERPTLLFLNWGEYVDEAMLDAFEEEYNCNVLMDLGESNEIFYSKVSAGTTVYDVVVPSDYMVIKMYKADLLEELDFSKFEKSGYDPASTDIRSNLNEIFNVMKSKSDDSIVNYFVPYLWGTWGIMYRTDIEGLEDVVTSSDNEWNGLFNREKLPSGTKIAMYDSHQHAYYAACRYLGYDVYTELNKTKLTEIKNLIKNMAYEAWGTDSIKKDIVAHNLDVGFMWTGDFLYYYCEQIANIVMGAYNDGNITYENFATMIEELASNERKFVANGKTYELTFDLFIPSNTIAFADNYVITKDSANKDLAYKFIDFMTSYSYQTKDEEEISPSTSNTYYVCYDTPFIPVYDDLLALKDIEYSQTDIDDFNEEVKTIDAYDSTLYWSFYDYAISLAFEKYYHKDEFRGSILATFSRSYVNEINTVFTNART